MHSTIVSITGIYAHTLLQIDIVFYVPDQLINFLDALEKKITPWSWMYSSKVDANILCCKKMSLNSCNQQESQVSVCKCIGAEGDVDFEQLCYATGSYLQQSTDQSY